MDSVNRQCSEPLCRGVSRIGHSGLRGSPHRKPARPVPRHRDRVGREHRGHAARICEAVPLVSALSPARRKPPARTPVQRSTACCCCCCFIVFLAFAAVRTSARVRALPASHTVNTQPARSAKNVPRDPPRLARWGLGPRRATSSCDPSPKTHTPTPPQKARRRLLSPQPLPSPLLGPTTRDSTQSFFALSAGTKHSLLSPQLPAHTWTFCRALPPSLFPSPTHGTHISLLSPVPSPLLPGQLLALATIFVSPSTDPAREHPKAFHLPLTAPTSACSRLCHLLSPLLSPPSASLLRPIQRESIQRLSISH